MTTNEMLENLEGLLAAMPVEEMDARGVFNAVLGRVNALRVLSLPSRHDPPEAGESLFEMAEKVVEHHLRDILQRIALDLGGLDRYVGHLDDREMALHQEIVQRLSVLERRVADMDHRMDRLFGDGPAGPSTRSRSPFEPHGFKAQKEGAEFTKGLDDHQGIPS